MSSFNINFEYQIIDLIGWNVSKIFLKSVFSSNFQMKHHGIHDFVHDIRFLKIQKSLDS